MTYEITKQDFINLLRREECLGEEIHKGTAREGHSKCNKGCNGNYFVGGECNWGGEHLMSRDINTLNNNFRAFDVLENKQIQLTTSKNEQEFNSRKENLLAKFKELEEKCCSDEKNKEFFEFTCIATTSAHSAFFQKMRNNLKKIAKRLERYQKMVEESTWEKIQAFKKKEEQLEKMQTEANQILEQWRNETDPVEKNKLWIALKKKQNEIGIFKAEMKKDPAYKIFSEEAGDELGDIVRKLWQNEDDFLKIIEEEERTVVLESNFQKWWRRIKWGGVIFLLLLIVFFIYRAIRKRIG